MKTGAVFNQEKIQNIHWWPHQEAITIQPSDSVLPTATALGLDCDHIHIHRRG